MYVQTVLGRILPEEMGFTLPHEHLFWDISFYLPNDLRPEDLNDPRNQPIRMDMLGKLHYHLTDYRDNLVSKEVEAVLRELQWFKESGGGTICECSVPGMGGDPVKVREVSRQSGIHIVKGTGAYCSYTLPEELNRLNQDQMAERFIKEITTGIDDTGIQGGFIGEIGINEGLEDGDRRTLAAAAIASRKTGASILIHQPGLEHRADEIFRIITDNGGSLERVVMCHCDPLLPDHDYIDHMAKSGAFISFDFFGLEIVLNLKGYRNLWLPTDHERIIAIREQINRGNLKHIVMSHDTVYKSMWRQYGGFGYAHLPENILPLMRAEGYEENWITQMTVHNPREIFSMKE